MCSREFQIFVFLTALLGPLQSVAAQAADVTPRQPGDSTVVGLPDSLKLTRLIDLTAEITGQSFSYNPQELGTITVTLRVPGGLSPENLPALLDHVLSSRGFTTVRTQGSDVLSVVKMEQAAGIARVQGTDPGGTALAPGFITELVEVRHSAVKDLAEAVKLVLSRPGGTATPVGQSGLLALSDLAPRVEEAKALIKRLDVASDVVVREITLENMPAAQVIALATQLVSKQFTLPIYQSWSFGWCTSRFLICDCFHDFIKYILTRSLNGITFGSRAMSDFNSLSGDL
jgi:type II secretory pathway component GspD/PulD (secretin)